MVLTPHQLDLLNGLWFEGVGGMLSYAFSVRALLRDKGVRGYHWLPVAHYQTWGLFNLLLYPSLGLTWSTAGGALVLSANTTWLALVAYYSRARLAWLAAYLHLEATKGSHDHARQTVGLGDQAVVQLPRVPPVHRPASA